MLSRRTLTIGIRVAVLGFVAVLGLAGCGPSLDGDRRPDAGDAANPNAKGEGQKVILTTFTVLADMGQNVAGDKAAVRSLVKPGAEIHGYEPTPSDLVRAQEADLILENGLNLERWAERFYNSVPKVPHATLSTGIEPVAIARDAYQGKPNPHAWMSPRNALVYVENIRKALANLDPANADVYARNAKTYSQQIATLDRKLREEIETLPLDRRYLVSCEGAFSYIARDYGLKEVYLWAVNSEQQATPQQIERVIKTVKTQRIPAVFCESTVSDKAQRQVAKEANAKFGGVFFVDSLSPRDGPASTYLKLLEHNIATLLQGLSE
ncbi:metal ABC transporter substrate-binding protein [Altericista sp. CCNU0014]|uniref:metal ABC transporter substrate-binding protein n=1 Tax=Altericista sp. CCNU0014 TaxID=3082949 RepID=UPI00384A9357